MTAEKTPLAPLEKTVPISVVINTLNEERALPNALRSVRSWCDDLVVVDMNSDDLTAHVAQTFGARVFSHERLEYADPARAFAIAQAQHDWVLIPDADEIVPIELAQQLMRVAHDDRYDVVEVPRQNFLHGRPVRGAGWGGDQDRYIRFFKRGAVEVTGEVHNFFHARPGARVLRLPHDGSNALLHFSYVGYASLIEKTNRYTTIEARGRSSTNFVRLALLPGFEFVRAFVFKRGYRDGVAGLHLSILLGFYKYLRELKIDARHRYGTNDEIARRYREIAERTVAEYDRERRSP